MSDEEKIATSADDLFAEFDCAIRAVRVPEWKLTVHLRELPADEGVALGERLSALPEDKQGEAVYLLLESCLCTKAGARLLVDGDARLRSRSTAVIMRLQAIAQELQGWRVNGSGESPGKVV